MQLRGGNHEGGAAFHPARVWRHLTPVYRPVWNIYRDYPGILIVLIYFRKWDGIVG